MKASVVLICILKYSVVKKNLSLSLSLSLSYLSLSSLSLSLSLSLFLSLSLSLSIYIYIYIYILYSLHFEIHCRKKIKASVILVCILKYSV